MPSPQTLDVLIKGITCTVALLCLLSITEYASKAVKHLREIRNSAAEVEGVVQWEHQERWNRLHRGNKNGAS